MAQAASPSVTGDMLVSDVILKYPLAADIMESYGLSCTGCAVNGMDTIAAGARTHGMSDQQVAAMVDDINEAISSGKLKERPAASEAPLTVTDKAAKKMLEILQSQGKAGWGIRVLVSAGGCAGYTYGMDFAHSPQAGDQTLEAHGVNIFVDSNSAPLLSGVTVDYVETLTESGFKFSNPNARASCGCGKSFA